MSKVKLQLTNNNTTIIRHNQKHVSVKSRSLIFHTSAVCDLVTMASCCTPELLAVVQKFSAAAILHRKGLYSTVTTYDRKTNQGWKSSAHMHVKVLA